MRQALLLVAVLLAPAWEAYATITPRKGMQVDAADISPRKEAGLLDPQDNVVFEISEKLIAKGCPRRGKFSTAKCARFYYKCDAAGDKATRVVCPQGMLYNPYRAGCYRWSADLLCPFVCPMPGKFNTTACATGYYKCNKAGSTPPEITCRPGFLYYPPMGSCQAMTKQDDCPFQCPGKGLFNATECAKAYYNCPARRRLAVKEECPEGTVFYPPINQCKNVKKLKDECPNGGIGGNPIDCPIGVGVFDNCASCETPDGVDVTCSTCLPGWSNPENRCQDPGVDARGCSNPADPAVGVLSLHNKWRVAHGSKALIWSNDIAARAQEYANQCVWGHSPRDLRPGAGENIFYSSGYPFPFNGLDACSFASQSFYDEVASYDFDKSISVDGGIFGHFTQVVWDDSTLVGCGYAYCPNMDFGEDGSWGADYVVCQYNPWGNIGYWDNSYYLRNIERTSCQNRTKDDWCSRCTGAGKFTKCAECFPRAQDTGALPDPILLEKNTRKCMSVCPDTRLDKANCQGCNVKGVCVRCNRGWAFDTKKMCLKKK